MGLKGLPETFEEWEKMRPEHIRQNLQYSHYTEDLFNQYRKHLGIVRYRILLEAQTLVAPKRVGELLDLRSFSLLNPLLRIYKLSKSIKADWLLKTLILPSKYKNEIKELDHLSNR